MGGKILFHRREAKEHTNEYGLVGGRTNLQDMKKVMGEEEPSARLLQAMQAPNSEPMFQAMKFTLSRELEEEANLFFSKDHYNATLWRQLKPYSQCMGAAPNYALTQYFFFLYHIELTTAGYFSLREELQKSDGDLIECSPSEIAARKTEDGGKKFAFNAVYRDFDDDKSSLKEALQGLCSSYENKYKFYDDKDALILSIQNDLRTGTPGKENKIAQELTADDKTLILGLGGHAKGLACQPDPAVTLHDFGWIEVCDGQLQGQLKRLAEDLRRVNHPVIEVMESRYFRLPVAPNRIYLDPNWFQCSICSGNQQGNSRVLRILRDAFQTPIGYYLSGTIENTIKRSLADSLIKVMSGSLAAAEDEDLPALWDFRWHYNTSKTISYVVYSTDLCSHKPYYYSL